MRHPEEHFSAYLDGELEAAEHQAVEAHLAECSACSEKISRSRRLNEVLSHASAIEPSSDFSRRVMQQVDQEKQFLKTRRVQWTILGLAAGIVLLVLVLRIQQEADAPIEVKQPKTVVAKPEPKKPQIQTPVPPKAPVIVEKKSIEPELQSPVQKEEEQKENIAEMKPAQPEDIPEEEELTSEEVELIANLDELENMDLIANYDQLQNLDIALFTSEEERQE